ncbi:MAG: 5-bromo-4-chloroindolyl phosphate hydrolysis family protein [Megasphaera sp.]|uniref:5-bromo-4-chloroindolyl phosphate hydrolysis family protein n=1 Tax=Megasphaera sp. TaxID=2023260 RepID=UPI003F024CD5
MLHLGGTIVNIFLYLIAIICFAVPSYNWFATGHLSGTFSLVFGVFILYWIHRRNKKKFKPELEFSSGNEEVDKLNDELFSKAVDDFNAIEKEMKHIDDNELRKQLRKMQGIAKNFLAYLQQHPERMSLSRRFVDYYQDRALLLVRKYQELEKTGLEAQEVQQAKRDIKEILDKFDEAYEDQFSKVLNAQLMDLDAEMKVMKQNMAADGIRTEQPQPKPQAKRSDDLVGTIIDLADQFLNTKRK